jgi:hypothetical protein
MTHCKQRRAGAFVLSFAAAVAAAPGLALDGEHSHDQHHHPITTSSEEAQRLFDEALHISWGFNHLEAARVFRAAAAADPECAMCHWGVAWVLGPNINAPADAQYHPEILTALARATALGASASERERAYITALQARYGPEPLEDRSALDRAFADAMRRVALRYPDDLDAATIFAEALMDTTPWDYWTAEGEPKQVTQEFLDLLEGVLRRDGDHPGANHLLIHTVEKVRPDLGIPAAERLEREAQATGHLPHMASHIYIRVGRYHDAIRVNETGIAADDAYAAVNEVPAEYFPYMLHNHHMLWAAATFAGKKARAGRAAEHVATSFPLELVRAPGLSGLQHFLMVPLFDAVRFGDWDRVMAAPEPAADLVYARGIWRFARGMAQLRAGEVGLARAELAALEAHASDPALAEVNWNFNNTALLLAIAVDVLSGEILGAEGKIDEAVRQLEQAVVREDALVYDEPPPWMGPARQNLGAVLLAAGRGLEAEAAFRADLALYPRNGWSLGGLIGSLEAQGKADEAAAVRRELAEAWAESEIQAVDGRF